MKRAVLYLRVSTIEQTTANQERELQAIAKRMGWEIVKVYKDHGISGAKGRNGRPQFDAMCRDATKRQFDVVMAWSVDRLGRSLQDLASFLTELHALRIDLFLHQQGIDTTTPGGCPTECSWAKPKASKWIVSRSWMDVTRREIEEADNDERERND
jgi:DNA invertase Pin-like site-specific DNA recombinase